MFSFDKWLRIVLPEVQLYDYVKQHGIINRKRSQHVSKNVIGKTLTRQPSVNNRPHSSPAVESSPISFDSVKEVANDTKKGIKQLRTKSSYSNLDDLFIQIKEYLNLHVYEQTAFIEQLITIYKKAFLNGRKEIVQGVSLLAGPEGTGKMLSLSLIVEQLYRHRLIPYRKVIEIDLSDYSEREIQTNFISDCAAAFEYGIGTVAFKGIHKTHGEIIHYITSLVNKGYFRTSAGITIEAKNYFIFFLLEEEFATENEALTKLPSRLKQGVHSIALSKPLSQSELERVAKSLFTHISEQLSQNNQLSLDLTSEVIPFLSSHASQTKTYGTALYEWIEKGIVSSLLDLRARRRIQQGSYVQLTVVEENKIVTEIDGEVHLVLSLEHQEEESLEDLLNELNALTGLKEVKTFVKELMDTVKIQTLRKQAGQKEAAIALHMIFSGNPGTGKTTVARLIGRILKAMGILSQGQLIETARQDLVGEYVGSTAPKTNAKINEAIGGILFIDEAYTLSRNQNDPYGQEAIDTLVKGMEDYRNDLVVILAGYTNEMNDFLKTNPGLPSRFPFQIEFPDYSATEMLEISHMLAKQRDYIIEDNANADLVELFEKKQISGRNDNGNGRLVRNLLEEAIRKQAARIAEQNIKGAQLNVLQKQDFGIVEEQPFQLEEKLSEIIGLEHVKTFVRTLEKQILVNQRRKKAGVEVATEQTLNMIFSGNPGTGKTTIGRHIAEMLKNLGVLKKGHLIEVGRTELISGYVGQTAEKTKEVVESALGGVLFIDEAYALVDKNNGGVGEEAINELVRLIEIHKDNLVVILAGYSENMQDFLKVNPGLSSRFPLQLEFPDYSSEEMVQMTEKMARSKGFHLAEGIQKPLKKWYETKQIAGKQDVGNGRLVRNVLEQAIRNQAVRIADEIELSNEDLTLLTHYDFNLEEQKTDQSALEELEKIIGLDAVKTFVQSLFAQIEMNQRRQTLGLPDMGNQSLHMVFKGNPGTGKTTIARIIAKRLNEMNVIKSDTLIETDRSGLVAGYVGQTALKTKEVIDQALGGVLFIDEAYSLAQDSFGKEAIDTLVKAMEDYKDELVVIVAGYDRDMDDFLNVNTGLRSRFPNIITFPDYSPNELLKISRLILHNKGYKASKEAEKTLLEIFKSHAGKADSGNGRFVRNVCEKAIREHAVRYTGKLDATVEELSTIETDDIQKGVHI